MKSTPLSLAAFATLAAAQEAYQYAQPQPYKYGGESSSTPSIVPAPPSYGHRSSSSSSIVSTTSAPAPSVHPYYNSSSSSSSPVAPAYHQQSSSSSSASYACNPAHHYGNGASCISTAGTLTLIYPTSTGKAYATPSSSCPAPGTYDSQGRYSCNPAHQYPEGQICDYVDGCPYLRQPGPGVSVNASGTAYPTATATPSGYGNEKDCYAKYNECRASPQANFSYCASQYAQCLGYNPFANNGTNTVTPKYSQPDVYTTAVVTSLTTYCPQPTTFTHKQSTYTVTSATTLTLPCPGGCTVTKPYGPPKTETTVVTSLTTYCPAPTTFTHQQSTYTITTATTLTLPCKSGCTITKTAESTKPVYSVPTYAPSFYRNTTIHIPVPPKTETTVLTSLTTYCPTSTIFTHKHSTYTVTKPTTLTLPCPGGCTVTKPVEGPKTTVPVVVPSQSQPVYTPQPPASYAVPPPPGTTVKSTPVAPSYPAGTTVKSTPVAPSYPAGTTVKSTPVAPSYPAGTTVKSTPVAPSYPAGTTLKSTPVAPTYPAGTTFKSTPVAPSYPPGTTLESTPVAPSYPAGTTLKSTPVAPTYPAGTTPAPSAPSATRPVSYPSSSIVQYTGAADRVMATGLPVAAAAVAAMLF